MSVSTTEARSATDYCLLVFQYRQNLGLDGLARHFDVAVRDVDVDFGADAEAAFEVDAGLDGEACARDDAARIPRLEVVDVGAVAVAFFADGVAGAVRELLGVARAADDFARNVVHLRGADDLSVAHGRADEG